MSGNLYWQHLTAGMHLAGANGATTFPDVKGHSFYRTGAVAISTAQSRFAGEGSAYFPGGTSDLIKCDAHADFSTVGTSLFVGWSMYTEALPASGIVSRPIMIGLSNNPYGLVIAVNSNGVLHAYKGSGGNEVISPSGTVALNQWQDFAICVINGTAMIWKNRAVVALLEGFALPDSGIAKRIQLGGDDSAFSSQNGRFRGYMAELVVSLSGTFSPSPEPPSGPFPEWLEPGVATAVSPLAAIRQSAPVARLLRAGAPELLIDIEHGGRGQVVGTTKNIGTPNYPVSRRVRLLRKRDGLLAREGWSDAGGNYEFRKVRHDIEYVVMSHDHTGLYNAVVADTVTPELMP